MTASRARILVTNDNAFDQQLLQRNLVHACYDVTLADNLKQVVGLNSDPKALRQL